MKPAVSIARITLRVLSYLFLILPLALPLGAPGSQQATQTADKDAQKQESPKGPKKVAPRVWTNDDFPSSQVVQPPKPEAKETKPKPDDVSHADPLMEKLLKMTPEERQQAIADDELDVTSAEDRIAELRLSAIGETDAAKFERITQQIALLLKNQSIDRHELEILRSIPPHQPARKDSEKNPGTAPTEPPAPETKTEATPPPDQH